jgi:pyruvate/2-oxoglutarate dehydrogenase complex dihydrolipoamide dehydrogenase (E3) component
MNMLCMLPIMEFPLPGEVKPDFAGMIKRSRNVADGMSSGIQFLFKKNKIETISWNR